VAVNSFQFTQKHTYIQPAPGNIQAQQSFDRLAISGGMDVGTDTANTFNKVDILYVRALLGKFLYSSMHIAQTQGAINHLFSFQRDQE
jgi:hypothetical protein